MVEAIRLGVEFVRVYLESLVEKLLGRLRKAK